MTPRQFVDAEPVRQHLLALRAAGITVSRIAQVADLDFTTVDRFLKAAGGRGRRRKTSPAVADAILAIQPEAIRPSYVDSTGTHRRVQALVAKGWPLSRLDRQLTARDGFTWHVLRKETIRHTTAETIEDLYEKLRDRRPQRGGVTDASAKRARGHAAARRWAPPSYWDRFPGAIDDPDFIPEYKIPRSEIVAEEARWLISAGASVEDIAARLGTNVDRVYGALKTHPGPAGDQYRRAA